MMIVKPLKLLAASLLLPFLLVSCGKKKGSRNTVKTTEIPEAHIAAIMNNQMMACDALDGRSCPGGIARLLVLNSFEKSSVCSGFMVNQDTLVTNQHCVPSEEACAKTYIAVYSGEGSSYESVRCSSVKAILKDYPDSNDPRKKLDVSVLKIDRPYSGPVFRPAVYTPHVNEMVTAWVVDHTGLDRLMPNHFESRITELQCRVSAQTKRESLVLANCPAISGNSGSPVLNSEGEVIGIIWGATAFQVKSTMKLSLRRSLNEEAAATEVVFFKEFF